MIYLALLVILLVQVARKKLDKLLPAKADPCRYMLPAVSPLPPWSLFYSVPRLPIMSCGPLQLSCLAWRFIIRSSSCKMSFYAPSVPIGTDAFSSGCRNVPPWLSGAASVHRAGDGESPGAMRLGFRSLSESVSDIHRCGRKNPHSYAPVGYVHPARWA